MSARLRASTAGLLIICGALLLAACSDSAAPFDPAELTVDVTTVPAPGQAGQPLEVRAAYSGTPIDEDARVSIEIRQGDNAPELADAVRVGDEAGADVSTEVATFTIPFTFQAAGDYDVYVHLYAGDYHLTKKRQVTIE